MNAATSDESFGTFFAALLQRFIATWESGDLDAFTALLADDALLSMPPSPSTVGR